MAGGRAQWSSGYCANVCIVKVLFDSGDRLSVKTDNANADFS